MRQPLNSNNLYQANRELYQNFFANYNLVVSSPGGVILAGALSHQFGGVGIHQRIPLRNHIGIKETDNEGEFEIETFAVFNIFTGEFTKQNPDKDIKEKLNFLAEKLQKSGFKKGLRFGLLNELPRRNGLNNPGVNAANIGLIYLYLTGKIDIETLSKIDQFGLNSVENETAINTIKEFHQAFIGPNNSGFGALSCLSNSTTPIVYQANKNMNMRSLSEIFSINGKESPFDMVIIGTSDRSEIDFSLAQYDHISDNFSIEEENLRRIRENGFRLNDEEDQKDFCALNSYRLAINASTVACLGLMGQAWEVENITNLTKCLEAFNNSFNALGLVGNQFKRKNKVANYIQHYFYKHPDIPFALSTSIANNLILITVREHIRPILSDLKNYLEKKLDFDISWPYISWIDNIEMKGSAIEQCKKENIYSSRIKNLLFLKSLDKLEDKVEIKAIDSKERFQEQFDLLLDADDKKIYIGARKIDSKDLPTSSKTIELFDFLMESSSLSLANNKIPQTSYFVDRNELQSKIISPLKILVEKELNAILNLKINGQITDFTISLFPSNLKIGLIKRI